MITIDIEKPAGYSFLCTVLGHGWHELAPFHFDEKTRSLTRIEAIDDHKIYKMVFTDAANEIHVTAKGKRSDHKNADKKLEAISRRILDVDRNLKELQAAVKGKKRYAWIKKTGFGSLMVSPTVWEDLAKTLLTTNTTWNVTKQMVARLCSLGPAFSDDEHAFPTPNDIADIPRAKFEATVRAGYRGAYLHEMAEKVANGKLDVEAWRDPALSSEEIYKAVIELKGFGPYAAATMVRLLGRFDRLAIDTSVRDVFRVQINAGVKASDADIARYYAPFGTLQGAVAWADVMNVNLRANLSRFSSASS